MLSPAAKHRYAVIIAVMVIGALLTPTPIRLSEFISVLAVGWALGQFLPWPPPR